MVRLLTRFVQICILSTSLIFLIGPTTGCHKKAPVVQVVQVPRPNLDIPPLAPLALDKAQWYVVTKSNSESVLTSLTAQGYESVLFALNQDGYEKMSINIAKMRAYIAQQQAVINAIQTYYKTPDTAIKTTTEGTPAAADKAKAKDATPTIPKPKIPFAAKVLTLGIIH